MQFDTILVTTLIMAHSEPSFLKSRWSYCEKVQEPLDLICKERADRCPHRQHQPRFSPPPHFGANTIDLKS